MSRSLPTHDDCGGQLNRPKIFFKEKNKTKWEPCGDNWWCRKCRKMVEIRMVQK